jgi:hypothetical protein
VDEEVREELIRTKPKEIGAARPDFFASSASMPGNGNIESLLLLLPAINR